MPHLPTRRLPAALALALLLAPSLALAHCDTLDGPVVVDARRALDAGDPTLVLKWVSPDQEVDIRDAFARTLAVRGGGPEARELADQWFFENLVRIHRASEGEPFTGLKPGGQASPPVQAADKALADGSADALIERAQAEVAEAIRTRFAAVQAASEHEDESVAAGREYVREYVAWAHFLEGLHAGIHGAHGAHPGEPAAEPAPTPQAHRH